MASASPQIDWQRRKSSGATQVRPATAIVSALGEFLLGYPNEYDRYTDRPLLDADEHTPSDRVAAR